MSSEKKKKKKSKAVLSSYQQDQKQIKEFQQLLNTADQCDRAFAESFIEKYQFNLEKKDNIKILSYIANTVPIKDMIEKEDSVRIPYDKITDKMIIEIYKFLLTRLLEFLK